MVKLWKKDLVLFQQLYDYFSFLINALYWRYCRNISVILHFRQSCNISCDVSAFQSASSQFNIIWSSGSFFSYIRLKATPQFCYLLLLRRRQAPRRHRCVGGRVQRFSRPPPGGRDWFLPDVFAQLRRQPVRSLLGLWGLVEASFTVCITGYVRIEHCRSPFGNLPGSNINKDSENIMLGSVHKEDPLYCLSVSSIDKRLLSFESSSVS